MATNRRQTAAATARVTKSVQLPSDISLGAFLGADEQALLGLNSGLRSVIVDNYVDYFELTGTESGVEFAERAIEELFAVIRSGRETNKDFRLTSAGVGHVLNELRSPKQGEGTALVTPARRPVLGNFISPLCQAVLGKTVNQQRYLDTILHSTMVFAIGPAGSGKTYLAIARAVQALAAGKVSRIIITRPVVEAGEHLGFLPGTEKQKLDPYMQPIYDALEKMLLPGSLRRLMELGVIQLAPIAYMRGRTLDDAFIVLDEAQNTSAGQIKMVLTRLGPGATIVVTGDDTQVDLPHGVKSGLVVAREKLSLPGSPGGTVDPDIAICVFGPEDVVRHRLVKVVVSAFG